MSKITKNVRPVRALIILSVATVCGFALLQCCMPYADATTAVLAHRPNGQLDPWVFWLRTCMTSLPCYLMLCISGLCCFAPALAAFLLFFMGLCDGAACAALWMSDTAGRSLLLPYAFLTLLLWLARIWLFGSASRTSEGLSDPTTQLKPGQHGISPLMLRHLTVSLSASLLVAVAFGIYTVWGYGMIT